jgi:hypothetical protein
VAPETRSTPPELLTVPPVTVARVRARNRTEPAMPSMVPEMPSRPIVAESGLEVVVRCGLSKVAVKVSALARSAVSRTTITWSAALAKTSR